MLEHRIPHFVFPNFLPADVERITGLSPVAIRDWRRRELIHPSLDRGADGFPFGTVAEFMLLKTLSDHGIGPKRIYGWSSAYSTKIVHHALDAHSAWASEEAWTAWKSEVRPGPERFMVMLTPPHGFIAADDLNDALRHGREVATIVDLALLGERLREKTSGSLSAVRWTIARERAD
ncbi:MAG: hypothetical protein AB7G25_07715 [Sphingomonadaceae bacterium]